MHHFKTMSTEINGNHIKETVPSTESILSNYVKAFGYVVNQFPNLITFENESDMENAWTNTKSFTFDFGVWFQEEYTEHRIHNTKFNLMFINTVCFPHLNRKLCVISVY